MCSRKHMFGETFTFGMPKIKVWEVTHHLGLGVDVVLLLGLGGHLHSGAVIVHWSTRRRRRGGVRQGVEELGGDSELGGVLGGMIRRQRVFTAFWNGWLVGAPV